MSHEEAIQKLRRVLKQAREGKYQPPATEILEGRDQVIERYSKVFAPEALDGLSAEEFRGFLLFRNNKHWWGIHRQWRKVTADMPHLREALKLLADESEPVVRRLDKLRPKTGGTVVGGLGRAVITAILLILHSDKYGVWNRIAEASMKELGLWPSFDRGAGFGQRYEAVNRILLETAREVDTDLWTLDMLWWLLTQLEDEPQVQRLELDTDLREPATQGDISFVPEKHLHGRLVDNWSATELGQSRTSTTPEMITSDQIDATLPKVKKGLETYLWLQDRLKRYDVGIDRHFQRKYSSFYGVQRTKPWWREHYYKLMESLKGKNATFESVLVDLQECGDRIDASFASKLVASLNPDMPVLDRYVLVHFGLRYPHSKAQNRLAKTVEVYEELGAKYRNLRKSPIGCLIVERFSKSYPEADITDVKKIDLVLWQTRD